MKPLHLRLQETRQRAGLPWAVLERDYLLSWILAGISQTQRLCEALVFKGGTALKKCYFGAYRLSEDLDFSTVAPLPAGPVLEQAMREVCAVAARLLDEYTPVEITCARYEERDPHPAGQEAFVIRARFPWQRTPQTRVMVEITVDEQVLKPCVRRSLIHEYGEPLAAQVQVYALEEIAAEKLRAILQHIEKLQERGWSRSRARDYYDLWRLLNRYQGQMDFSGFSAFLHQKCALRHVDFAGPDDFFQEPMLAYVEQTWNQWLGPLVPGLPAFAVVIGELRPQIAALLAPE